MPLFCCGGGNWDNGYRCMLQLLLLRLTAWIYCIYQPPTLWLKSHHPSSSECMWCLVMPPHAVLHVNSTRARLSLSLLLCLRLHAPSPSPVSSDPILSFNIPYFLQKAQTASALSQPGTKSEPKQPRWTKMDKANIQREMQLHKVSSESWLHTHHHHIRAYAMKPTGPWISLDSTRV